MPEPTLYNPEQEFLLQREAFCEKFGLKTQWEQEFKSLSNTGILTILPELNVMGVIGLDPNDPNLTKEYPIPTYEDIKNQITPEKLQTLETKYNQGFTKLLLTPMALPLEILILRYKELIIKKHKEGKLLATDGSRLELRKDNNDPNKFDPIYIWDEYLNCDQEDSAGNTKMTYYPKSFNDPNFKGFTLKELLTGIAKDQNNQAYLNQVKSTNGWTVSLIEDLPDLPAQGEGEEVSGRKQLEANQSSIQYLEKLQNPQNKQKFNQYANELGLTLQNWLIYAITHLEETNTQIDNYQGQGKACYLLASFLSGKVPRCFWDRAYCRAGLDRHYPSGYRSNDGTRSAVIL